MDARETIEEVDRIEAVDRAFGFRMEIEARAQRAAVAPIETVSQSEKGFDRIHQGSTIWLAWRPAWTGEGRAEISVGIVLENR